MREYTSVLRLVEAECPEVLSVLSEEDKSVLGGLLDYEAIVLRVSGGMVSTVDSIDETVYGTETMREFIDNTLQWISEEKRF